MNNSIYKKLISDMTLIIILPIIIVICVVCCIVCYNYYSEQEDRAYVYVSEYVSGIRNEMMSVENVSESILKYNYILNNLTREYKDNYDRLEVTLHVASYLESVMGENITLYLNGEDVFRSKYILPMELFEKYEEVNKTFDNNNTNMYWDNNIFSDSDGKYLLLYRRMTFNKNSIMVCKVHIPSDFSGEYDVGVMHISKSSQYSEKIDINNDFYVGYNLDTKSIGMMITLYIILFVILGVLVTFAMLIFSKSAIKRTTQHIDNFIVKLKGKDILNYDFDSEIKEDEFSELAVIKRTMNLFVNYIKELSYNKYENELERKKLEVDLLQSKIDPHLLYNSLTVIKLSAIKANDKKTIEIIDNLVSYYRAVLSRGRQYVSLSGEIELLEKFIKITEISNGKTYDFYVDIPDNLKDKQILHLMLQPFLENALVHGFAGRRENCVAKIKCRHKDGCLFFEIFDNGYGMSESTLIKLNNIKISDEGYGIKNVYTRILLEYGEQSKIEFESVKDEYTKVTLKIPYEI